MYDRARRSLIQFLAGLALRTIGLGTYAAAWSGAVQGVSFPDYAVFVMALFPVGYVVNIFAVVNAIQLRRSKLKFNCNWSIAAIIPFTAPYLLLFYLAFIPRHARDLKKLKSASLWQ